MKILGSINPLETKTMDSINLTTNKVLMLLPDKINTTYSKIKNTIICIIIKENLDLLLQRLEPGMLLGGEIPGGQGGQVGGQLGLRLVPVSLGLPGLLYPPLQLAELDLPFTFGLVQGFLAPGQFLPWPALQWCRRTPKPQRILDTSQPPSFIL